MVWVGLVGLVLAAGLSVVAAVRGLVILPEGDLSKAITFNAAIGLFWLTLAFILPLANFGTTGRRIWLTITIALSLYAYGAETIQISRGIDPRFSKAGGEVDGILSSIFGGVAITIIIMVTILAVKVALRGTSGPHGLLLLALRYAFVATTIGFAAGIWMGVNQGRFTGAAGNILPLHALGFHALQAIPLVAWLFSRSSVPAREARLWIHAAGAAWIVACLGLAWQTALGRPVTEPSVAMLVAVVVWLFWVASAVRALLAWRSAREALA